MDDHERGREGQGATMPSTAINDPCRLFRPRPFPERLSGVFVRARHRRQLIS